MEMGQEGRGHGPERAKEVSSLRIGYGNRDERRGSTLKILRN